MTIISQNTIYNVNPYDIPIFRRRGVLWLSFRNVFLAQWHNGAVMMQGKTK